MSKLFFSNLCYRDQTDGRGKRRWGYQHAIGNRKHDDEHFLSVIFRCLKNMFENRRAPAIFLAVIAVYTGRRRCSQLQSRLGTSHARPATLRPSAQRSLSFQYPLYRVSNRLCSRMSSREMRPSSKGARGASMTVPMPHPINQLSAAFHHPFNLYISVGVGTPWLRTLTFTTFDTQNQRTSSLLFFERESTPVKAHQDG